VISEAGVHSRIDNDALRKGYTLLLGSAAPHMSVVGEGTTHVCDQEYPVVYPKASLSAESGIQSSGGKA
jgi:hypothetical protein